MCVAEPESVCIEGNESKRGYGHGHVHQSMYVAAIGSLQTLWVMDGSGKCVAGG